MWYGLQCPIRPDLIVRKWGARAIYRERREKTARVRRGKRFINKTVVKAGFDIDCLHDRQQHDPEPDDPANRGHKAFVLWINTQGLKRLRAELERRWITPDSAETVLIDEGWYGIAASPRRTYGYLYIVAWETRNGEGHPADDQPPLA